MSEERYDIGPLVPDEGINRAPLSAGEQRALSTEGKHIPSALPARHTRKDQAGRAHRVVFLRSDEVAFINKNAANWRTCCEHLPLFHEEWTSNGFGYYKCQIAGCPCEEHNDELQRKARAHEAWERETDAMLARQARHRRAVAWMLVGIVLGIVAAWTVLA